MHRRLGGTTGAYAAARRFAQGDARASQPHVRRRRRAQPQARDRPRAVDRGRGAGEESGLRHQGRRSGARLRVVIASLEHRAACRRHSPGVARPAPGCGSHSEILQRTRAIQVLIRSSPNGGVAK